VLKWVRVTARVKPVEVQVTVTMVRVVCRRRPLWSVVTVSVRVIRVTVRVACSPGPRSTPRLYCGASRQTPRAMWVGAQGRM